jgi:peptidoglycan hydrolase-like protein with peptidoglycan-binding domain
VANVSYLRAPGTQRAKSKNRGGATTAPGRKRGRYVLAGLMLVAVAAVVVAGVALTSAKASLSADPVAIAKVGMPLGGGSIQSITVVTGPHSQAVPVHISGGRILPDKLIPANEKLSIQVVVKRPGWIAWLAGHTQKLSLSLTTPVASLRSHYVTVRKHGALRLRFKSPVSVYSNGAGLGHLRRNVLGQPSDTITLPHHGEAGTLFLSAAPRTWESAKAVAISYFPAGNAATAVARPAPGSSIKSGTSITLTFSKPVSKALGKHLPPVSPSTPGAWHSLNSHTIQFRPTGYGYGLGAKVQIALPSGVRLLGGQQGSAANSGTWTVPGGTTARLQQLLSLLGYLPLKFNYAGSGPGRTPAAQEGAAVDPPAGKFSWKYDNTPTLLKDMWKAGTFGTMTQGALMAFETDHDMLADGVAGPQVWRALISAAVSGHGSTFGYTFVSVSESSQSLNLWHSGKTVIGGTPVNTGIPAAPTAVGTYPVYEHLPVTTMSGTNPDGSHYSDPGIPDVSYFNGGDALHGFTRAQYGFPQSLGCVEMPYSVAAEVYPYTPVGTLVHVA